MRWFLITLALVGAYYLSQFIQNVGTQQTDLSTVYSVVQSKFEQAQVTRVVDGDTIEVSMNNQTYKVRYIGIDTPETVDPRRPVGYFGKEASTKNKELVMDKVVRLEKDVSNTDKYDRLLRYVYVGETMINGELVRLGYAKAATYPPDVKYATLFTKLEKGAMENNRGLWGE